MCTFFNKYICKGFIKANIVIVVVSLIYKWVINSGAYTCGCMHIDSSTVILYI